MRPSRCARVCNAGTAPPSSAQRPKPRSSASGHAPPTCRELSDYRHPPRPPPRSPGRRRPRHRGRRRRLRLRQQLHRLDLVPPTKPSADPSATPKVSVIFSRPPSSTTPVRSIQLCSANCSTTTTAVPSPSADAPFRPPLRHHRHPLHPNPPPQPRPPEQQPLRHLLPVGL